MLLGQNPGLEGKTRSVRRQRDKVLVLRNHSQSAVHFLPNNVAEHATFLVEEILLGAFQFLRDVNRKNGQCNQLRVRMLQRRSRGLAVVFEDQDVFEAAIFFQIEDAVPERPQNVFNAFGRQRGEAGGVVGRLNNDFVRPDSVHAIKHALRLAVERAFNTQSWKLIGHDANRPTRGVPLRRWPAVRVRTVGLNLGRRLGLVSVAKGTKSALDLHIFADKIGWALRPVRRNNHPAAHNRIFSQLRQLLNPFSALTKSCIYRAREASRNPSICGRNWDAPSIRLQDRISIGTTVEAVLRDWRPLCATSRRLRRPTAALGGFPSRRGRIFTFTKKNTSASPPIRTI